MSGLSLCAGDPLLDTLRELFLATPLRVPEQRVTPLAVVAAQGSKARFLGDVESLLTGADEAIGLELLESRVAPLSSRRSRVVNLDLALEILKGFLPVFGVSVPAITAALAGASHVAFSFDSVTRAYVEVTRLGQRLTGRGLDLRNPVNTSSRSNATNSW